MLWIKGEKKLISHTVCAYIRYLGLYIASKCSSSFPWSLTLLKSTFPISVSSSIHLSYAINHSLMPVQLDLYRMDIRCGWDRAKSVGRASAHSGIEKRKKKFYFLSPQHSLYWNTLLLYAENSLVMFLDLIITSLSSAYTFLWTRNSDRLKNKPAVAVSILCCFVRWSSFLLCIMQPNQKHP